MKQHCKVLKKKIENMAIRILNIFNKMNQKEAQTQRHWSFKGWCDPQNFRSQNLWTFGKESETESLIKEFSCNCIFDHVPKILAIAMMGKRVPEAITSTASISAFNIPALTLTTKKNRYRSIDLLCKCYGGCMYYVLYTYIEASLAFRATLPSNQTIRSIFHLLYRIFTIDSLVE